MKQFKFFLKNNKVKCSGNRIHRSDNKKVTTNDIIEFILSQKGDLVFVSNYSDIDWVYKIGEVQIVLKNVRELINSSKMMDNLYHELQERLRKSKRHKTNINFQFFKDKKQIVLIATSVALASTLTIYSVMKMLKKGDSEPDIGNKASISQTYDDLQEQSYNHNSSVIKISFPFECGIRLSECQKFFEEHYEEDMLIKKHAECYGVDYNLIRAIAYQESRGNHNIKESSAIGIMQIEKVHLNSNILCKNISTGKIDKILITKDKLRNKEQNIQIGVMMLRNLLNSFNNNPLIATQAYNFGSNGMKNILKVASEDRNVDYNYYLNNSEESEWLYYRQYYKYGGDKEYCEHVLRFCTDEIKIHAENGDEIVCKIMPINENKKMM